MTGARKASKLVQNISLKKTLRDDDDDVDVNEVDNFFLTDYDDETRQLNTISAS